MNTDDTRLREILRSSRFRVADGRFAVMQIRDPVPSTEFFMITRDQDEITIVVDELHSAGIAYLDKQEWFKLVEIKVSVPFFAYGFLATITSAIASHQISILIVSTFSKDYLLIREQHINTVADVLSALGLTVESNSPDRVK